MLKQNHYPRTTLWMPQRAVPIRPHQSRARPLRVAVVLASLAARQSANVGESTPTRKCINATCDPKLTGGTACAWCARCKYILWHIANTLSCRCDEVNWESKCKLCEAECREHACWTSVPAEGLNVSVSPHQVVLPPKGQSWYRCFQSWRTSSGSRPLSSPRRSTPPYLGSIRALCAWIGSFRTPFNFTLGGSDGEVLHCRDSASRDSPTATCQVQARRGIAWPSPRTHDLLRSTDRHLYVHRTPAEVCPATELLLYCYGINIIILSLSYAY